ncbi:hypothetical protein DBR40_05530 [Pedobacter sp. KBW01]|uniref:hypothetical protein n=1 Tax=Pedobacter sp. KBW01 TaxID=2153364 RepID=UPI000F5A709E|nr:hypothetical protein [Pedobacter sp. KBW01]RQO78721.1 hypothetical protein DBR40_05530 [Pedobacter sp. KBW01]
MANGQADEDKYIIIDIAESGGTAENFIAIDELISEADYQQFLNSYIEPNINFNIVRFRTRIISLPISRYMVTRNDLISSKKIFSWLKVKNHSALGLVMDTFVWEAAQKNGKERFRTHL